MSQTIFLFKFLFPLNSFRGNITPQVAGGGCQQQDNQMNSQNNQNQIENGQNQQNGLENNNQLNSNNQNNFNSNNNCAENGTQQENEFQQDDVNQQQFYSSSSVDSNTTAASETHYLKFFKKQFCEQSSSNNYINNFIRIPPSSKKIGQSKKIQDAKLAGFDNQINSNNNNEYQFIQQQQQFLPDMYQNQEQLIPQNGFFQQEEDFMQIQENKINYNVNGYEQNNYEGSQQSDSAIQNNTVPPLNNINNLMGKKGFKINLTNLNKNNNQVPNIIHNSNNNNSSNECDGQNQNFKNHFQKINQQVQQFEPKQNQFICENYYRDQNQMVDEEEEQDYFQTVVIDLNFKHGNIDEDPQEKAQHFYKPNFGGENNQNNLNLPIQNDANNFHQNSGRDSRSDDPNSPNNNHQDEIQGEDPYNNPYNSNNNNANAQLGQPLPSYRGSSGPNQTSNSIMVELMRKNQLPGIKLGKINGQNNFAGAQKISDNFQGEKGWIDQEPEGYEPNCGELIIQEQEGEKINTTKMIKIFGQICSEITPNFLYVSGEDVANNKQKLKQNGITHIINCAGDVCKNLFPEDFVYKTYRLKDAKTENIECIFYDTIKFIEGVSEQGGRVFIHCVQGISRSVTLCIAYKIWKEAGKLSFQDALKCVKEKRHVASPNQGFLVQLINFHKRLYGSYDSISVKPRVWCVCSHQVEEPHQIVAKMLLEGLYSCNKQDPKDPNNKLDPRGVFIIQAPEKLYIWIGNEIPPERQQIYQDYSLQYLENLRQYEHAPQEFEIVRQGSESEEFWQMWLPQKPLNAYSQNREWNNWFLDITKSSDNYKQINYYDDDDDDDEDDKREVAYRQNNKQKPKLFIYPEKDPLNVFDLEDLMDDSLCILCKQQDDQIKIHIWRGSQFTQPDEVEKDYLDQIIQDHYPNHINNILLYKEILHQESEEFNECFYQN
ncbi:hypothetical protein ABPG72_022203 [Tetrahymena utriculariae]